MITNDNPVTIPAETVFNGMWVRSLLIDPSRLVATLLPYDGGLNVLALGGKTVVLTNLPSSRAADPLLDAAVAAVHVEAARLAGNETPLVQLRVAAPAPGEPIVCALLFEDRTRFRVDDCEARMGEDAVFATSFNTTMAEIARLAGLTVS